jgi:hypothetical protein
MATIEQIIGKINPKLYAKNGSALLKKYKSSDKIPAEEVKPTAVQVSFDRDFKPQLGKKGMSTDASHSILYDSSSETLEPIYFWVLEMVEEMGFKVEKLVDNFTSSPGSGHFAELGQRATIMQQQGQKILGDVNTVLRSVLNIIYDLKEFRIRLDAYNQLSSKDKSKKEAAIMSLKQIWMDKVDMQKGNSSIKGMALGQAGFQTLIDAFLVVKDESLEDSSGEEIDLNDRVKRILKPRIVEFNLWMKQSEIELRKRYQLEKTYLKSQVSSLKLYSRWAKPYLKAAFALEQKDQGRNPNLVKTFNTILLELTLLGKRKLDVKAEAIAEDLPRDLIKLSEKMKRTYYSCLLVDFKFRGIPKQVAQQSHYAFGGQAEFTLKAYALNDDEIKKLDQELAKSDMGDVLKLIEGTTEESLEQLQEEIDFFLDEKDETQQEKEKQAQSGSNPFMALLGKYDKEEKPKEKKSDSKTKDIIVKTDNFIEGKHVRPLAAVEAAQSGFTIFDVYKKAHGMPSYT